MLFKGNHKARLLCVCVIFLGATPCLADETHTSKTTTKAITHIVKTDFAPDNQLSPQEIKQVLALAKQFGITNAGIISTLYSLPGGRKEGVSVQSVHRIDGRNTRYETLDIRKNGWSYFKRPTSAKHIGNFWINTDEKIWPTLLRSYPWTNQQPFQVSIGENVDIAIADKMVGLAIKDKLPFSETKKEGYEVYTIPERPSDLRPESIRKGDIKNTYEAEFKTRRVFKYKFEKSEFIYIGGYQYEI